MANDSSSAVGIIAIVVIVIIAFVALFFVTNGLQFNKTSTTVAPSVNVMPSTGGAKK